LDMCAVEFQDSYYGPLLVICTTVQIVLGFVVAAFEWVTLTLTLTPTLTLTLNLTLILPGSAKMPENCGETGRVCEHFLL
jgi:hypothetical protein